MPGTYISVKKQDIPDTTYRGDHMAIDDENWKCFVNSTYDKATGEWKIFKKDYQQLVA